MLESTTATRRADVTNQDEHSPENTHVTTLIWCCLESACMTNQNRCSSESADLTNQRPFSPKSASVFADTVLDREADAMGGREVGVTLMSSVCPKLHCSASKRCCVAQQSNLSYSLLDETRCAASHAEHGNVMRCSSGHRSRVSSLLGPGPVGCGERGQRGAVEEGGWNCSISEIVDRCFREGSTDDAEVDPLCGCSENTNGMGLGCLTHQVSGCLLAPVPDFDHHGERSTGISETSCCRCFEPDNEIGRDTAASRTAEDAPRHRPHAASGICRGCLTCRTAQRSLVGGPTGEDRGPTGEDRGPTREDRGPTGEDRSPTVSAGCRSGPQWNRCSESNSRCRSTIQPGVGSSASVVPSSINDTRRRRCPLVLNGGDSGGGEIWSRLSTFVTPPVVLSSSVESCCRGTLSTATAVTRSPPQLPPPPRVLSPLCAVGRRCVTCAVRGEGKQLHGHLALARPADVCGGSRFGDDAPVEDCQLPPRPPSDNDVQVSVGGDESRRADHLPVTSRLSAVDCAQRRPQRWSGHLSVLSPTVTTTSRPEHGDDRHAFPGDLDLTLAPPHSLTPHCHPLDILSVMPTSFCDRGAVMC